MKKGDLVLVPFPFTDLKGKKTRPALVLVPSDDYVCVCFITTNLNKTSTSDILINPSKDNRLKKTSLIKLDKITTIDRSLIIGRLGSLAPHELSKVNEGLTARFQLK
ncbi:transcriptional modulator of MazE/toxin, MazF [Ekhidna lutea]|uniref:Transcriptional modulator of MazE/toxin, MazF n=1 Tax=Ekhidna lutea TaxID=447679 RepID=A0A239GR97_EKHLU|nr:type II toxin-antitoxin system PemK/MazF family toxin [Ekhidna lutea]SNS71481.1 transcriptional modulator of MazE/toxin, MazF [Ekhidna lutea]